MTDPASPIRLEGIKAVLLDIEGTISSISFVKDTLYPYSLAALPAALDAHFTLSPADQADVSNSASLAEYVGAFPEHARHSAAALAAHVHALVAADVKDTALKKLQGRLWQAGFESGALVTPLFADVEPQLRAWRGAAAGRRQLAIFSSGSVPAQKMFVAHVGAPLQSGSSTAAAAPESSSTGADSAKEQRRDLTALFDAFFDTENAGPKIAPTSYTKIVAELGQSGPASAAVRPEEVLFLSDNVNEIRAALQAGLRAIVVERPGNEPLSEQSRAELVVVPSFDQLELV